MVAFDGVNLELMNASLRHRYCSQKFIHSPIDNAASIKAQRKEIPKSFLGRQPGTKDEIKDCISCVSHAMRQSESSRASAEAVSSDERLLDSLWRGYGNVQRHNQLCEIYKRVILRLEEKNVDINSIKIVAMVCCGGAPFRHYGMGDSIEESVDRQVELAVRFGMIYDLVPCTFGEFESSLLDMSVAVGAVLLQKLKNAELGRGRTDGILFCCKGTMSVALASRAFSMWSKTSNPKEIALVGMGTDLSQGFTDWDAKKMRRAGFSVSVINSVQDTNVGSGKVALNDFILRSGEGTHVVWVDTSSMLDCFGGNQPEHMWYYQAFWRLSADRVRCIILSHISSIVKASPTDSSYTFQKIRSSALTKTFASQRRHDRARTTGRTSTVSCLPSKGELLALKLSLKQTDPKVKHLVEWVHSSSMFIKE